MKAEYYNKYPEKYVKEFKEIKESVIFRLINIQEDPDNKGKFLYPSYRNVKAKDRIALPVGKDETEIVDIAYITGISAEGAVSLGEIAFSANNAGTLRLNPKNASDRDKLMYMLFCNANASNEHRDTKVPPIFERVDPKANAQKKIDERKVTVGALAEFNELSDEAILTVFGLLFPAKNAKSFSFEEKQSAVMEVAFEDSKRFLKAVKGLALEFKALVEEARQVDLIISVQRGKKVVLKESGDTLFNYQNPSTAYEEFARHLSSNPDLVKKLEVLVEMAKVKETSS